MLARLARELPRGDYLYEPKWDGFRALAFVAAGEVDLRSRHGRPLARYFPELLPALAALGDAVLDGEIVVEPFAALMARLHPAASRVERLARETPARFLAFDLLAEDALDLRGEPLAKRRSRLEALLAEAEPPLVLTEATSDAAVAGRWLAEHEGVVAKPLDLRYEPGKRVMTKVKHERTADCVVAGFRWRADRPELGSLLLGLYDGAGALRHVGVVTGLAALKRHALLAELEPLAVPIEGHPWERGFGVERSPLGRLLGAAGRWVPGEMELEWVPVRPERVAEVAYDQTDDHRFRHPARFRRWRPDREPQSCRLDQLD